MQSARQRGTDAACDPHPGHPTATTWIATLSLLLVASISATLVDSLRLTLAVRAKQSQMVAANTVARDGARPDSDPHGGQGLARG